MDRHSKHSKSSVRDHLLPSNQLPSARILLDLEGTVVVIVAVAVLDEEGAEIEEELDVEAWKAPYESRPKTCGRRGGPCRYGC